MASSPRGDKEKSKGKDKDRNTTPHLTYGLLGPARAGKSALLNAFLNDAFVSDYDPMIYQTFTQPICVDGDVVFVTLHDTSGYQEFWSMTEHLLQKAHCFMLCFSVCDRGSFEIIEMHYEAVHKCQPKAQLGKIPMLLVGCQADNDSSRREVLADEIQCLADSWGVQYIETSAKDHINVNAAFLEMARIWQNFGSVLGDRCTRGYLKKAGDTGTAVVDTLKSKQRWCLLNGPVLRYYEKEEHEQKGKHISELNLANAVLLEMDEERTFKLDGPGLNANKKDKAYVFTADTEEDFLKWKTAITACIKNCKEAKAKEGEKAKQEAEKKHRTPFHGHRRHKEKKEKKEKKHKRERSKSRGRDSPQTETKEG